jgi:hypothetical protein
MAARSVLVRIDEDQAESYRAEAETHDRSLSAEIRQALRRDRSRLVAEHAGRTNGHDVRQSSTASSS